MNEKKKDNSFLLIIDTLCILCDISFETTKTLCLTFIYIHIKYCRLNQFPEDRKPFENKKIEEKSRDENYLNSDI